MKKIVLCLALVLLSAFSVFADGKNYEIGTKSDNYIIVNADYVGLTNVNVKYYLNPEIDGDRLTETIYFSTTGQGNIYIHKLAIYWNGVYYKKESGDSIITNIWTSSTVSRNAPYSATENTDIYWLTMREDTSKSVYKMPYVSGLHFEASSTYRGTIDIRFYKENEDVVTSITDVNKDVTVIKRYDLNGREVSPDYKGLVIEKLSNNTYKKVLLH